MYRTSSWLRPQLKFGGRDPQTFQDWRLWVILHTHGPVLSLSFVIACANKDTSSAQTALSRDAQLPGSEYAELQEDQMQYEHSADAGETVEMPIYLELI